MPLRRTSSCGTSKGLRVLRVLKGRWELWVFMAHKARRAQPEPRDRKELPGLREFQAKTVSPANKVRREVMGIRVPLDPPDRQVQRGQLDLPVAMSCSATWRFPPRLPALGAIRFRLWERVLLRPWTGRSSLCRTRAIRLP